MDTIIAFLWCLVILGGFAGMCLIACFIGSCMAVGNGSAPTKVLDITDLSDNEIEYLLCTKQPLSSYDEPTFTGKHLSKPFKHVPTNHATDRAAKDFPRATSVRRITH